MPFIIFYFKCFFNMFKNKKNLIAEPIVNQSDLENEFKVDKDYSR